MARAVKGFDYGNLLALTLRRGADVERMEPHVRKAYLQRHLRVIDAQIRFLAHRLDVGDEDNVRDWTWSDEPLDNEKWASLVSLDYLVATREAIRETLRTL